MVTEIFFEVKILNNFWVGNADPFQYGLRKWANFFNMTACFSH